MCLYVGRLYNLHLVLAGAGLKPIQYICLTFNDLCKSAAEWLSPCSLARAHEDPPLYFFGDSYPKQLYMLASSLQINFLNKRANAAPLRMTVENEREASLIRPEESTPAMFHRDDFVLLSDDIKFWMVRIQDISLLEARQNFTLVHFPDGKLLIRRSLGACERRLDSSIFFRASRGCIVNLSQVKQPRLSNDGRLIFLLKGRKRGHAFSEANRSLPCDTRSLTADFKLRQEFRRHWRISVDLL